jgi:hypothetical protein
MNEADRIIAQHENDMDRWADICDGIKDGLFVISVIIGGSAFLWLLWAIR